MSHVFDLRGLRKALVRILALLIAIFLGVSLLSLRYPLRHLAIIKESSEPYGIDPAWICAVIHAESKFAETALSRKGASGLMQLTEGTAEWTASRMGLSQYSHDMIFDPEINIKIGCGYLAWLLGRYERSMPLALAAYNAGSGNVDKWLKNPEYSKDGASLDKIPFGETRDYVKRVNANKLVYSFLLKLPFFE